ncbi:MAG: hypothetical protein IJS08_12295 [Victivallales bacterium]|nr:hypothetical protein [Victivallales bacterium]
MVVNVELTPDLVEILTKIMEMDQSKSKAQAIRKSIKWYGFYLEKNMNTLIIKEVNNE